MTERIGTCKECGAKYKIPTTFTGTKAKCKKCGDVVVIEEAGAGAAEPPEPKAPSTPAAAAAAAKKKAPAVRAAGRSSRAGAVRSRGGRAAAASRRRPSRGDRASGDDAGGSQQWIWIVAGISVVAIVILLIVMFSGGSDEPQPVDLTVTDTAESQKPEIEPEETTLVEEPPVEETEPVAPPEKPVDERLANQVGDKPEDVDPVIKFDPLPKIIGCDDEVFERLTYCFENGFVMEELRPWDRKKLRKEFDEAGNERLPVYINAFRNIDLLKGADVALAFRIAEKWNAFTGAGFADCPVRGDSQSETMKENLVWNSKAIYSIYDLWHRKADDVNAQQIFFDKMDRAHAKAATKKAAEDE